jgi:hypothetical protein
MFPVNASRFRQYRPIYIYNIIYVSYNMYMEQDSVVGIETSCELEGSGLRSRLAQLIGVDRRQASLFG